MSCTKATPPAVEPLWYSTPRPSSVATSSSRGLPSTRLSSRLLLTCRCEEVWMCVCVCGGETHLDYSVVAARRTHLDNYVAAADK